MNKPETPTGYADIRNFDGTLWVCCPYCGKKQFPVDKETKISNLKWKCKGSDCKRDFEINK